MDPKNSYSDWIGRTETAQDNVDESRVAKMYATLNMTAPGLTHGSGVTKLMALDVFLGSGALL